MTNITSEVLLYNCTSSTKGGHKVTLQVTDRETIDQLEAIGLGKQFMMVLAPIADDGTRETTWPKPKKQQTLSNRAAMMLQYAAFPQFVNETYAPINAVTHENADEWLKQWCGVKSKREFDTEHVGAENFKGVELEWDIWSGRISGPR